MAIAPGPQQPKLLVVDDEQQILDLLKRRLEALGCAVFALPGGVKVVQTARDLMPDLILLDVMMPDLDGFSVCQALKADAIVRDIPVIMMTARSEVDSRIKGLEMGAHDYVAKPFETAELIARIRAALRVKQLQDDLKDANRKLERLATSDPLTDLPNRRTFGEQFFLAVERSRRSGEVLSVMMIDLDRFKGINDTYGHQVGDDALRALGRLVNGRRRVTDLVGRYGGEEFVWVLLGAHAEAAAEVGEWLRRTVEALVIESEAGPVRFTVSAGLATYTPAADGPMGATAILEAADEALREAKAQGRNRLVARPCSAGPRAAHGLSEAGALAEELEEAEESEEASGLTRYR
jgi:two-component system cell cycle response regulator